MNKQPELNNATLNTYSFGVIPTSAMTSMATNYYPMFLTDVAMISPAMAGTILLISRLINIFMAPIAGAIIERTNLKWGKYRSWIMLCPPFATIFFILMFIKPGGISGSTLFIYLAAMYVIAHVFVTFANSGMAAVFPILGATPENRIRAATRRAMGMSSGQIIFSFVGVPLMIFFGFEAGNDARGMLFPVIIYGVLSIAAFVLVGKMITPFDPPGHTATGRATASFKDMFLLAVTNKPLLILTAVEVMRWTSRFLMTGFLAYNFRYIFGNMMMIATMMTASNLVSFACTYLGQPLAMKFGRKTTYIAGNALLLICYVLAYLFFRENVTMYVLLIIIGHAGYGPAASQTASFYADAADYTELTSKKSVKGLIMSLQQLPMQISLALSGAIIGYGLAIIGFDAALDPTAGVLSGIAFIATMIPAIFLVLTLIGIQFYKLDNTVIQKLREASA